MRPVGGALRCRPARVLAWLVLGALAAGCNDKPLPGTMYGRYKVTGEAKVNSCGRGLGAPDPWVFDAELSQEGATIYWSWLDGSSPLSGLLVSSATGARATITTNLAANVDPGDASLAPCTLARADDIELTLPAGSSPATFSGTITYAFAPQTGSTCTDQLTTSGGTYDTLPCTVSYAVTATRR